MKFEEHIKVLQNIENKPIQSIAHIADGLFFFYIGEKLVDQYEFVLHLWGNLLVKSNHRVILSNNPLKTDDHQTYHRRMEDFAKSFASNSVHLIKGDKSNLKTRFLFDNQVEFEITPSPNGYIYLKKNPTKFDLTTWTLDADRIGHDYELV